MLAVTDAAADALGRVIGVADVQLRNRKAASPEKDRALARQSSNSCHDAVELSSSSLVVSCVAR